MIMIIMIKVLGKGRACIPEGLIKAYGTHGPIKMLILTSLSMFEMSDRCSWQHKNNTVIRLLTEDLY